MYFPQGSPPLFSLSIALPLCIFSRALLLLYSFYIVCLGEKNNAMFIFVSWVISLNMMICLLPYTYLFILLYYQVKLSYETLYVGNSH